MTAEDRQRAAADVSLRDVREDDLDTLYEHQLDPEATRMAAFPSREKAAFLSHWARILADETIVAKAVVLDGVVAGNVVSWVQNGEREVGYWIGREFWGRGVATAALALLLAEVAERPLYAHIAAHNAASRRVLEKCGFVEDRDRRKATGQPAGGGDADDVVLRLGAGRGHDGLRSSRRIP